MTTPVDVFGKSDWTRAHPRHLHHKTAFYVRLYIYKRRIFMSFLDFIYPKFCLGCGKFGTYVCADCFNRIPQLSYLTCPVCRHPSIQGRIHTACRTKFGLDGLISLYAYRELMKQVIKKVKYRYAYRIFHDFLRHVSFGRIKENIGGENAKSVLIIPIPLHVSRLYERGFNQSDLIAHYLGKQLLWKTDTHVLERIRKTTPQVEMKNREGRIQNIQSAFSIYKKYVIPKHTTVVLVDDVYTTGATMQSAAFVLKQHGVHTVWGFTLAQ